MTLAEIASALSLFSSLSVAGAVLFRAGALNETVRTLSRELEGHGPSLRELPVLCRQVTILVEAEATNRRHLAELAERVTTLAVRVDHMRPPSPSNPGIAQ